MNAISKKPMRPKNSQWFIENYQIQKRVCDQSEDTNIDEQSIDTI